ncbi:MAG TPA: hypothetical protein DCG32_03240 [Sphaerochaeta sp.]|jgi:hypothetical protein|nr:hypothetical protein [Sphaerochaeta sp.]
MYIYYGVLLCCHLVGDFYLQSDVLARHKQTQVTGVLLHSLLYVIPFVPLIFLLQISYGQAGLLMLALGVTHVLVDSLTRRYCTFTSFLIDQSIHIGVLLGMALLFPLQLQLPASSVGIAFALLFIFKPSSVAVSRVLASLASTPSDNNQDPVHAGYKIGYLERLIILLLCLFGSISTCVLVIAAKTLVRYAEFSNDSEFREVFLVGTLMSIALALIGYGGARLLIG